MHKPDSPDNRGVLSALTAPRAFPKLSENARRVAIAYSRAYRCPGRQDSVIAPPTTRSARRPSSLRRSIASLWIRPQQPRSPESAADFLLHGALWRHHRSPRQACRRLPRASSSPSTMNFPQLGRKDVWRNTSRSTEYLESCARTLTTRACDIQCILEIFFPSRSQSEEGPNAYQETRDELHCRT